MTVDEAPDEDILHPVFTYEAVVSLEIEEESARFDSDPSDPATRIAIVQPLEWIEIWPDLPVDTPAELQAAAFAKLYLLLSFGSELGGRTGDEIREALDDAYPELARLRLAGQGAQPLGLARYGVRGMILSDGSPQWGIQIPARAARGTLPGIPTDGEAGEGALKIYAQNQMRARMHDLWRGAGEPLPSIG